MTKQQKAAILESSSSSSSEEEEDDNNDNDVDELTTEKHKSSQTKVKKCKGATNEIGILKINQKYAKEYTSRKQREELRNAEHEKAVSFRIDDEARDRDGSGGSNGDDDESESSDEDEDAELITHEMDARIDETLQAIRNRDKKIYDKSVCFFPSIETSLAEGDGVSQKETLEKPKRYKDVVREQILEQLENNDCKDDFGAVDEEEQEDNVTDDPLSNKKLAYDEEQESIRKNLLNTVENSDDDELLTLKKSKNPKLEESNALFTKNCFKDDEKELIQPKGSVEKYLSDFMKNKRWMDYGITTTKIKDFDDNDGYDSAEEMDAFESRYNFRFEEQTDTAIDELETHHDPNKHVRTPFIVSYARSTGSAADTHTLRKKDDSRKRARLARKERKLAEKKQKEEQLKRLKNAKRVEMEQRMKAILKVAGHNHNSNRDTKTEDAALSKLLEGDYKEDEFEELMQSLYDESYYAQKETNFEDIEGIRKEIFVEEGFDDDVAEKWVDDNDDGVGDNAAEEGDYEEAYPPDGGGDFDDSHRNAQEDGAYYNKDQDYDGKILEDREQSKEGVVSVLKDKIREKIQNDLYKLDYEDMIGDMPCRFKYRRVESDNYGLSPEEILFAKDSTLRQYVSLKKLAPYREPAPDNRKVTINYSARKRFQDHLKQDWEELLSDNGIKNEASHEIGRKQKKNIIVSGEKTSCGEAVFDVPTTTQTANKNKKGEGLVPTENCEKIEFVDAEDKIDISIQPGSKKKKTRKKKGKKIKKQNITEDDFNVRDDEDEINISKGLDSCNGKDDGKKDATNHIECNEQDFHNQSQSIDSNFGVTRENKKKKRKRARKNNETDSTKSKLEIQTGLSASRLASYGLQ